MPTYIDRTPTLQVASLSPTALDSFRDLVEQRLDDLGKSVSSGGKDSALLATPLAAIVSDSNFISAAPDRFVPNRGNVLVPYYVVVARVASAAARVEQGNLLSAITDYTQKGKGGVTPHLLIGFSGELIQLVDLDHTARYLARAFPPPTAELYKDAADRVVDHIINTVAVLSESGVSGYSAFNGEAFGFIQFHQKHSLWALMKEMYAADAETFVKIFDGAEYGLSQRLLNQSALKTLPLGKYESAFRSAGTIPLFQQAQRRVAKNIYWREAIDIATRLGIKSQRGYAMVFDSVVQRPGALKKAYSAIAQEYTELAKLVTLARIVDAVVQAEVGERRARRHALLNLASLSDAPITAAVPPSTPRNEIEDESVIVCVLEGRTGDDLTAPQCATFGRVLQIINGRYGISISPNRVFGLDSLPGANPPGKENPGKNFNVLDYLSGFGLSDSLPPEKWFKPAQPLREALTSDVVVKLVQSINKSRSKDQLANLAIAEAYQYTIGLKDALALSRVTRGNLAAAASDEAFTLSRLNARRLAGLDKKLIPNDIKKMKEPWGLLYDFDTGLWNDGKPVGKISRKG